MSAPPTPPKSSAPIFWIFLTVIVAVIAVASYAMKQSLSRFELSRQQPLPILRQISEPFTAAERLGDTQNLADLKGKVVVLAYTYSRCPRGCAGVAAQMLKIRDQFASNPAVHLVSLAAWPEVDSPAVLKAFAESIGVKATDPWWWVSGDKLPSWAFMTDQIGFEPSKEIPQEERLNPDDAIAHDLRAVLIDPKQRVRAFYSVMHPQTEVAEIAMEKLARDIQQVLAEP
jgi:protein SCO1/2